MLAAMLLEVCKNPTQPGFNHFLFESVAALIRYGTAADASMLDAFQEQLFPAFQVVLSVSATAGCCLCSGQHRHVRHACHWAASS